MENPVSIKRSWALSAGWRNGPAVANKLVPAVFGRISTPFIQTWRTVQLPDLDFGAQSYQITIPESIRILSAAYLEIELTGKMKAYPALYCVRELVLRSAGQEVYRCNMQDYLTDYCESLSPQALKVFAASYLGGQEDDGGSTVKNVKIPILLPNSAYLRRSGINPHGHGVLGCQFGNQKLIFELTLNTNLFPTLTAGDSDVASIAGKCSISYHCVEVPNQVERSFSDVRGIYNIVTRRFVDLTQWTHYANANQRVTFNNCQPVGAISEIMALAVPYDATASNRRAHGYIKATFMNISHDYVVQKELSGTRISSELFSAGFIPPNDDFASPARLCFAAHAAEDMTTKFLGAYDASTATNLQISVEFAEPVMFKLVSVAYANVKLGADGIMTSSLDGI